MAQPTRRRTRRFNHWLDFVIGLKRSLMMLVIEGKHFEIGGFRASLPRHPQGILCEISTISCQFWLELDVGIWWWGFVVVNGWKSPEKKGENRRKLLQTQWHYFVAQSDTAFKNQNNSSTIFLLSFFTLTSPLSFPLPKFNHRSHLLLSLNLSFLSSLSLTHTHSLISLPLSPLILSHSLSILPKGIFSPNFNFFH